MGKKKLPDDFILDAKIEATIRAHLTDSKLHCVQAFAVAAELNVPPHLIGQTADALGVSLDHCQLGLYGYPGHTKGWEVTNTATHTVPDGLEGAIRAALNAEGKLTCPRAWAIAAQFTIPKMLVGYVADQIDVRIIQCQLGSF
jgi:hypothetical protein